MRFGPSITKVSAALAISIALVGSRSRADEASEERCRAGARPFALGDQIDSTEPAKQAESVGLSRKARELALRGDYARAADLFAQAYALWGNGAICSNTATEFALGMSEYRAGGRLLDAAMHLRDYSRQWDREPEKGALAEQTLQTLYNQLGRLEIVGRRPGPNSHWYVDGKPIPSGRIHAEVPPGESRASLGDPFAPTLHWTDFVDVLPGAHEIVEESGADWEGKNAHLRWRASIVVKAGETLHVTFDVGPDASGPLKLKAIRSL